MSWSKRAPEFAAPDEKGNLLRRPDGRLRTGWLLAASLFGYALARVAALGLAQGFASLFRAWGVDAQTAYRAPAWARLFWRWQGSVLTVLFSLALLLLCRFLRGLWQRNAARTPPSQSRLRRASSPPHGSEPSQESPCLAPKAAILLDCRSACRADCPGTTQEGWDWAPLRGRVARRAERGYASDRTDEQKNAPFEGRKLILGAATGLGLAGLVLLMGLIPDSLRMERAAPNFTPALPVLCAVSFLVALAEEAFTKRVLYDGLAPQWGRPWAAVVAVIAFFLMNGSLTGFNLSALNVLLLGALCCAVYARFGLWAAVGLRWAWSVATVFLMGFGGGEASLLRFYSVSEAWLTGGDSGPIYGLWATLAFALALAWVERERLQRKRDRG